MKLIHYNLELRYAKQTLKRKSGSYACKLVVSVHICKAILFKCSHETGKTAVLVGQCEDETHRLAQALCSPKRYGPIVHVGCSKLSNFDIDCT